MLAGVTIVAPESTVIDAEVAIGEDTVIAPFTSLHGTTTGSARAAKLGPRLDGDRLADRATRRRSSTPT